MRQKVAEEHVCATNAYNPCIAAMVHHHSITAFATESCSTLSFVAARTEQGVATTMAVTTGGSIPQVLCAPERRSHSHTWRELCANHQVVSLILPETGYMGMVATLLPF